MQMRAFYEVVIAPLLIPVFDLTVNTAPKVAMAGVSIFIMWILDLSGYINAAVYYVQSESRLTSDLVVVFFELIETPLIYWVGLMTLAGLDFLAGTFRALTDPRITWKWERWTRSGFKMVAYPMFMITTAIAGNLFPPFFGWIQYASVAIFTGAEVHSVARNLGFNALAATIKQYMDDKVGVGKDFMETFRNEDLKQLRNQQRNDLKEE